MPKKKTPSIPIILSGFDNIEKATAPNFFYAKLRARMEQEQPVEQHWWNFKLSPAILSMALVIVLMMNMAALKSSVGTNSSVSNVAESSNSGSESFATEYQLYTETIY